MEVVLLIEQKVDALAAIKQHFLKQGNTVIVEPGFKTARKRLSILETTRTPIKVLVMDEDLPKEEARRFFAYVKARFPKVEPISMAKNDKGVIAFQKVKFKAPLKLVEKPDLSYSKEEMMKHAKKLTQMHRETIIPPVVYPRSFIRELALKFLNFFKTGESEESLKDIKAHAKTVNYPVTPDKIQKLRLVWDAHKKS